MIISSSSSLSNLDPDFTNYYHRVVANGGNFNNGIYPVNYTIFNINKLFNDLKINGLWSKILEFGIIGIGVGNLNAAMVKCKFITSPLLTNNNFVAGDLTPGGSLAGLKGDGSTKWLDIGINTSALGQDDNLMATYVTGVGTPGVLAYTLSGTTTAAANIVFSASNQLTIRNFSTGALSIGSGRIPGLVGTTRASNDRYGFNRTSSTSGTQASSSFSEAIVLFRRNNATAYFDGSITIYCFGVYLDPSTRSILSAIFDSFHSSFGYIL